MPPLPKRKTPKSKQRKRRTHQAIRVPHVISCPNCRSPRLAHTACPICGTYKGRDAVRMTPPDLEE